MAERGNFMMKKLITVMMIIAMSTISVACGASTGDEEAAVSGSGNEVVTESNEDGEVIVDEGESSSETSDEIYLPKVPETIKNATVIEEVYDTFGYPETSVEDSTVDKDYIITTTHFDFENNHYISQLEQGAFRNGAPYEPTISESADIIDVDYAWWLSDFYDVLTYDWEVVDETEGLITLTCTDIGTDLGRSIVQLNEDPINLSATATYDKEIECWNHIEIEVEYATGDAVETQTPNHIFRYELTMTDVNNTTVE